MWHQYLLKHIVFIVANIWLSLQQPNDNVYRPDENELQNVTQHISVSMKDQHWDYFQLESRIPQINRAPIITHLQLHKT